jgi:hypothetical protein
MDGEPACTDEFDDLVEAGLAAVEPLGGDPRCQIAIDDAEEDGFEDRSVVVVEGTVDEDVAVEAVGGDVG